MKLTRRETLRFSVGVAAFATVGVSASSSWADVPATEKLIMELTGGKTPEMGKVSLTAPEIAENGNTVPVGVDVDSQMIDGDMVEFVVILAESNPVPEVVKFNFTAMSGVASATTRMRLAKTQNVIALAKMVDGSVYMDKKQVKVTIGGCGG